MSGRVGDIIVALDIPADEYVRVYQGTAKYVVARSQDGRTVRFPVNILQRFLTRDGIQGVFRLRHDANNKFVSIERIGIRPHD